MAVFTEPGGATLMALLLVNFLDESLRWKRRVKLLFVRPLLTEEVSSW